MDQSKNMKNHDTKQQFFLHELLNKDQEPFLLTNYISDKQNQLTIHYSSYSSKKHQKPVTLKTSTLFPIHHLCKNALCFNYSSATTTPDITKSPLFRISQHGKSPCSARASNSPNAMFLHVPARTASILLEAALRIQKHSNNNSNSRNNNNNGGGGFGFFGSFFRRFTQRGRRNNKRQIQQNNDNNSNNVKWKKKKKVKDLLKLELDSGRKTKEEDEEKKKKMKKGNVMVETSAVGFRCSCSEERVCSSSNAYSCCFVDDDNEFFCESPFRFVLQRSPSHTSSSGRRTPEFSSPASSPNRHRTEDKEDKNNNNNGDDGINKFQSGKQKEEEEEEEDKEQCSPVSVLDPPFEDDDDVHESNDDDGEGFDLDCSYANVQRTKQQLLYRLSRFEKLAELDPLKLEQRILDQENEDIREDGDSESSCEELEDLREIVYAILNQSSRWRVPEDLKRLVYDLIMEEEETAELDSPKDMEMVIRRVCKRLELWKEVESNTIDMMIDEDFSREEIGWKKNSQQIRDLAGELEFSIFALLVEEFSEELAI